MTGHVPRGGVAQLFRSRVDFREELDHATSELIGDGDLAKMVRLALSDPDQELWRYSISAGGKTYFGEQILGLKDVPG